MRFKLPADRLSDKQIYKRRWLIAAVMNLALVMVVMAVSSVNVALPTLVRDLGATARELQWIVDSYALVFAGLLLAMGAVGDRYGRRGAFFAGLSIFGVASVLSAYADNPAQLIAWRALMGVGAALIMPATLSIITNVFDEKERPKAVAMWAGFAGAGASIGPVVSGLLLRDFWWGSIFLALIPVIILAMVLAYLFVPTSKDPEEQSLDFGGSALSMIGLGALLYGIIEAPEAGWGSATFIISMIVGVLSLAGFVWWEKRIKNPMLPMYLFKSRMFSMSSAVILLTFFTMFGVFFLITQYLQFVLGDSALTAALKTLPIALVFIAFSQVGPSLAKRWDVRTVMSAALLFVASGVFLFTTLTPESTYFPLLASLVIMGSGMAIVMPLSTDGIIGSVPKRKAGVGSAVNDATREIGGAVGIAVLGSILSTSYKDTMADKVGDLQSDVAHFAEESIGGALSVAGDLGERGTILINDANNSFTDGMSTTFLVGGLVIVASSFAVLYFLPKGEHQAHTQKKSE